MEFTKKQNELCDSTIEALEKLNLKEDDYDIFWIEEGSRRTKESTLCFYIQFRQENNNIIEVLKGLGWKKAKTYKNFNGNTSFYASDLHSNDVQDGNIEMVRMMY